MINGLLLAVGDISDPVCEIVRARHSNEFSRLFLVQLTEVEWCLTKFTAEAAKDKNGRLPLAPGSKYAVSSQEIDFTRDYIGSVITQMKMFFEGIGPTAAVIVPSALRSHECTSRWLAQLKPKHTYRLKPDGQLEN